MDSKEIQGVRNDIPLPQATKGNARQRPLLHSLQDHMRQMLTVIIEQMYQIIRKKSLLRDRFIGGHEPNLRDTLTGRVRLTLSEM